MSWLGGSISSLTGQLTNLTKDILTEGTEEISDHSTELQLANEKIQSADNLNNAIKKENERLGKLVRELEEKAESSELQINSISREYRILLEEKEKENKELKKKQHELLEFQAKSALSDRNSPLSHSASTPSIYSSIDITGSSNYSDDTDIGDTISLQHEVNRLRQQLLQLQSESQHWKSVAGQLSGGEGNENQKSNSELLQLKTGIQELENQLIQEKDAHQHEVISLQDVHRQKLSNLKKSHKQDVARLEEKLAELQDSSKSTESNSSLQKLEEENQELRSKMEILNQQIVKFKSENESKQKEFAKLQHKLQDLEEEKKASEVEMVQLRVVKEEASHLQSVSQQKDKETLMASDISDPIELKEQNLKLQEEIKTLEKTNEKFVVEKDLYEQRLKSYRRRLVELEDDGFEDILAETDSLDVSRSSLLNDTSLTTDIRDLQNQIKQYQHDIDQFEMVKSDWLLEKEALEDVVMNLRTQLKQTEAQKSQVPKQAAEDTSKQVNDLAHENQELEKERDHLLDKISMLEEKLQSSEKEREELNVSLTEQKATFNGNNQVVEEKDQRLKELQQEKEELETSLDELDLQHQEEQLQLINIKNNLAKKAEKLSMELNEKEAMLADLSEKLQTEKLNQSSQGDNDLKILQMEEAMEKLSNELNTSNSKNKKLQNETESMKVKLQNGAVAINDMHMDKQELQTKLDKMVEESEAKTVKFKALRTENSKLKEETQNLKEKIEDLEEDIDKLESINESNQISQKSDPNFENLKKEYNEVKMKLVDAETEVVELKKKMEEYGDKNGEDVAKIQELVKQIQDIKDENSNLKIQLQTTSNQNESLQKAEDLHLNKSSDLETQLDAMISEKQRLEKELDVLEQKYANQVKQYDKYIKDLEENKNLDQNSLQQEHQKLAQTVHQKENEISVLKSQIDDLNSELDVTKETMQSAVDSQQQIAIILRETEEKVTSFQSQVSQLETENEEQQYKIQEQELQLQSMHQFEETVQKHKAISEDLKLKLEESEKLAQQTSDVMADKHKTLAVITELETELTLATDKINKLETLTNQQATIISDHEKGISLLNQKAEEQRHEIEAEKTTIEHQDNLIAVLRQNSNQKEENLDKVHRKLNRATSFLNDDQKAAIEMDNSPDFSLPAIEYKVQTEEMNGFEEDLKQVDKVNAEFDKLEERIAEKDQIISDLQKKNSSLLKVLESKSLKTSSSEPNIVDVQRLENDVRKLTMEKEQIMAVMNEKSRESSTLKTEVHRLMNIVAAERTALNKLQRDNHDLNQKRDNPHDDMQKAALQQLSRLIRDKDVEIEALKQKNDTLLAVLQDSSADNSQQQMSKLLSEKEELSKKISELQGHNEQMVVFVNTKHQESVTYHNEVQRLSVILHEQMENNDHIKAENAKLAPQFEEKKQSLLKLQDELLTYKQKFQELEVKYGEMLQRSNIKDTVDKSSFDAKGEELKRLQEKFLEMQKSVQEKDLKIQSLSHERGELQNEVVGKETDKHSLKKQVDHLQFQIEGMNTELGDLRTENMKLNTNQAQSVSEVMYAKDSNNKLSALLREKDLELNTVREKCETLNNLLQDQRKQDGGGEGQGQQVPQGQVDRLVKQMEVLQQQTLMLQQERDQTLTSLQQHQHQTEQLVKEVERLKEREVKLTRENDRLRSHLIQVEEGYTREALESEEREKELRNRVAITDEKLVSASYNVETSSHQLTLQIEELKYQLQVVSSQRDASYSQVTSMQDQCQQYASSLANLQLVLEQFQQDKDNQIATESEKYQEELETLKIQYQDIQSTYGETKTQLEEASEGLEAAARLSVQLDKKEEAIHALRDEVQLREKSLKQAEEEIKKLTSSTEAKVDKELMKNLLLGYFTTPQKKRSEVVHTIGGVLNFNPEEFNKISASEGSGGWVPGLFKFGRSTGPTPPATPVKSGSMVPSFNQSFSQLFVKFLETESTPAPEPVRLPAEQMAQELQQKHREKELAKPPAFNPFTAPRHVAMPINISGNKSKATDSHILMASSNTPSFTPMFTMPASSENISQPGSGRSTPSNSSSAILKNVLENR